MEKIRPGIGGVSEFPPVSGLLSKKNFPRHNILVGDDPVQIRFAEQVLDVKCEIVEHVKDEDLLVQHPTLHQVFISNSIDLSQEIRSKTGVWSLSPIVKGSASANAIIKAACEILGIKLERSKLNRASDLLTKEPTNDVRASLWYAIWIISGDILDEELWKDPWVNSNWLPKGTDPNYRLNSLYKDLVGHVFIRGNDEVAARRFGISPAKIKRLKNMSLDLNRVYESIFELSKWRQKRYDPYICALKISKIWEA